MKRRMMVPGVEPVRVDALPEPCRHCVYWEVRRGRPGTETAEADRASAQTAKDSWWRAADLEWGPVGYGIRGDPKLRGFVVVGPSHRFPRAVHLGRTSPDALLLAQWWTASAEDEDAAAALLRASMLAAAANGFHAIEAFGGTLAAVPCHPSAARLQGHGFSLHRPDPRYPLLRLDLRQSPGLLARVREVLGRLPMPLPREEIPNAPSPSSWQREACRQLTQERSPRRTR